MMLFCKYGSDPSDPEAGFVFAHHDDDKVPPAGSYPGCIALPYTGTIEVLGKFGAAPANPSYDFRHFAAPRLTLALAQSVKLAELSIACGTAITAGFTSSALGSANVYPAADEDQRNLTAAAGAAIMGQSTTGWSSALKCAPAGQKAVRQPHTAAQVHTALGDFVAFKDAATAKFDTLRASVLSATSPGAVAAIVWS